MTVRPALSSSRSTWTDAFLALDSPRDLARLLEVPYDRFVYLVYKQPADRAYRPFQIPKRAGGYRQILAPTTGRRILQQKLAHILGQVYEDRYASTKHQVFGFRIKRGIAGNASKHVARAWVLRVDLEDFFPTIIFPRVYGLFTAKPFNFHSELAAAIANLTTYKDSSTDQQYLPQGAPSSPTISNLICARLDRALLRYAQKHHCRYTRYADDLCFSFTHLHKTFPPQLASPFAGGTTLGPRLIEIIEGDNGFRINYPKTRLAHRTGRQLVTGIVVNERMNPPRAFLRRVRAMLHAWERHGLVAAQDHYENLYRQNGRDRHPDASPPTFAMVTRGMIEYVGQIRGRSDPLYLSLLGWHTRLDAGGHYDRILAFMDRCLDEARTHERSRIAICWDVLEAARGHFGGHKAGRVALKIDKNAWAGLCRLANDEPHSGSRHRGQWPDHELRPPTPQEQNYAFEVATKIRQQYASHVAGNAKAEDKG